MRQLVHLSPEIIVLSFFHFMSLFYYFILFKSTFKKLFHDPSENFDKIPRLNFLKTFSIRLTRVNKLSELNYLKLFLVEPHSLKSHIYQTLAFINKKDNNKIQQIFTFLGAKLQNTKII